MLRFYVTLDKMLLMSSL